MFRKSEFPAVADTIGRRVLAFDSFSTPLGNKRFDTLVFDIVSCGSRTYSVVAYGIKREFQRFALARTFPMSYKACYQLVCSL